MPLRLDTAALEWRQVGADTVVLNTRTAHYLSLNASGSYLWSLLLEEADEPTLIRQLRDRYELQEDVARQDVACFLSELRALGVFVADSASPA